MRIDKDDDRYEPSTTRSSFRPEQGSVIHIPIERREETIPEGYVKVVRCKDCAFWSRYDGSLFLGECSVQHDTYVEWFFCADGVPRIHANGSITGKGDETE